MAIIALIIVGATVLVFGGSTFTLCYCFHRRRRKHIEKIYETVTTYQPVYDPVATHDAPSPQEEEEEKPLISNEAPTDDTLKEIHVDRSPMDVLYENGYDEETSPLTISQWTLQ